MWFRSVNFSHSVMSDSFWPSVMCDFFMTLACQASLSVTNTELAQIRVHQASVTVQPSHPLSSPFSPAFNLAQHQGLLLGQSFISFSFSISPSNEYSGLISFSIDWFYLLAVQGTLKSLLQHHSSKASTLWCSAFFVVQLSYPYMATGKTIALTRQTFVGKVMSLLFNMLSRLVIAFLSRSKRLLISLLPSSSAASQNKVCHCFHCFPIYLQCMQLNNC